ncbi:mitochondrial carrier homolog 1-like isoform X3 [Micropterus dolomieu]|uniref:mitochondrial carrier homolog 1-like isoform X3 n=1 Tax=Micropterus dolomieu TaxID=147949 RepID=UPI001E8D982A|nr:mitochondrial carrier homolog 1-like isoform X3 [Micropterus dolomieu]
METLSGQAAGAEPEVAPVPVEVDAAVFLLGAGVTAITHPLLYVKLLIQVGHEPLPPTVGTTMFGRRVLYLPGFFSYAHHIVKVDGKKGLFRGLSPRLVSSAISTVVRSKVKQIFELAVRCMLLDAATNQAIENNGPHSAAGLSVRWSFCPRKTRRRIRSGRCSERRLRR